MAKSHQLWGEQGLARPQVHVLLGKAWLPPGPSSFPFHQAAEGIEKWQQYLPGIKKSAKCLSPKRVHLFQLCFTTVLLKQPAQHCVPEGHHVTWGWGHWTCSGSAFGAPLEPASLWYSWNTDCPSCTGSFGVSYCFCAQDCVICCLCNRSSQ